MLFARFWFISALLREETEIFQNINHSYAIRSTKTTLKEFPEQESYAPFAALGLQGEKQTSRAHASIELISSSSQIAKY